MTQAENTANWAHLSRITLNWPIHDTHFQRAVIYRLGEQKKGDQEQTDVGNEHSTVILCIGHSAIGHANTDSKENHGSKKQQIAPFATKICTDRRNLTAVGAPSQVVLQCVKQKRVVTMTAGNAAHTGHR